jgi:hypothetical protein
MRRSPDGDLLSDEMDVELDMLRPLVMYGVACHVYRRYIVPEHDRSLAYVAVQLAEEVAQPCALGDGIGDAAVLRLGARP